jgi:hypothetical protein
VDTGGVGDDNSHDQDDGVFDGDNHGIDDDDDLIMKSYCITSNHMC